MTEQEIREATPAQLRVMVAERLGWKPLDVDDPQHCDIWLLPGADRYELQLFDWPNDIALAIRLALDYIAETNWDDFSIMAHGADFVGCGFRSRRIGAGRWPPEDNYIVEARADIEGDGTFAECVEAAMAMAICRAWLLVKLEDDE